MKLQAPFATREPSSVGHPPYYSSYRNRLCSSNSAPRKIAVSCLAVLLLLWVPQKLPISRVFKGPHSESSLSQLLYQEVNAYRVGRGARVLPRHTGLDRLARDHSEYLRRHRGTFSLYGTNVSHMGFEGRARMASFSFNMVSTSENVAFTMSRPVEMQTVKALVQLWQHSPNHEYTMSQNVWTDTGIGAVIDWDGAVFVTQIFGAVSNSQISMQTPFESR